MSRFVTRLVVQRCGICDGIPSVLAIDDSYVELNAGMSIAYQNLLQEFVPRPINSERAYQHTLKQVDGLIRKPKRSRAEDDLLELLATLVEQYEIRSGFTEPPVTPRDRLAGLIEARGLSQAALARQSNVPRSTINEILAERRGISKTNAVRLARFFGVPVEEFIGE